MKTVNLEQLVKEGEEDFNTLMTEDFDMFLELSTFYDVAELLETLQEECQQYGWEYSRVFNHLKWV